MFDNIYYNKRVLITGHTGFKGSWLALWLLELGAKITGYSLPPPTEPNHYQLLKPDMNSVIGDIRDADNVKKIFREEQPEIVFHLAAQPIVRFSYQYPVETFTTNVLGTINILEAARECDAVNAFVNVTSDKCYENKERHIGYIETDPLGGYDPYSASKGCSEIVTGCWRNSFFNLKYYGVKHNMLLASTRAGNVIGGGDWASDRLVPDIMRAVSQNEKVRIRNPHATRAWQHVLEPLSGYLLLGEKLLKGTKEFAEAWNFGPLEEGNVSVGEIVDRIKDDWPKIDYEINQDPNQPHEANILRLDSSKARSKLQWLPVWDGDDTIRRTTLWYRSFYEYGELQSNQDLKTYIVDAGNKNIPWAVE
jgi:CDP-glucose 4,6-dehydratase